MRLLTRQLSKCSEVKPIKSKTRVNLELCRIAKIHSIMNFYYFSLSKMRFLFDTT